MPGRPSRKRTKARYGEETFENHRFQVLQQKPLFQDLSDPLKPKRGIGVGQGNLPKFQTPEAMEFAIDLYFKEKFENNEPPTIPGMALALGFKSRHSLISYKNKSEAFSDIIETAFTKIEEYKNTLLLSVERAPQGVMFDLTNNHGWVGKSEVRNVHEAGDTLSVLFASLQGSVLRPIIEHESAVEAQFEPVSMAAPEKDPWEGLV